MPLSTHKLAKETSPVQKSTLDAFEDNRQSHEKTLIDKVEEQAATDCSPVFETSTAERKSDGHRGTSPVTTSDDSFAVRTHAQGDMAVKPAPFHFEDEKVDPRETVPHHHDPKNMIDSARDKFDQMRGEKEYPSRGSEARLHAREGVEHGKAALLTAKDSVVESARRLGADSRALYHDMKQDISEDARELKDVTHDVKEEARDGIQDVRNVAHERKEDVKDVASSRKEAVKGAEPESSAMRNRVLMEQEEDRLRREREIHCDDKVERQEPLSQDTRTEQSGGFFSAIGNAMSNLVDKVTHPDDHVEGHHATTHTHTRTEDMAVKPAPMHFEDEKVDPRETVPHHDDPKSFSERVKDKFDHLRGVKAHEDTPAEEARLHAREGVNHAKAAMLNTKDAMIEGARETKDDLKENVREVRDESKDVYRDMKDDINRDAREVQRDARDVRDESRDGYDEFKRDIKHDAREVRNSARDVKEESKDAARDLRDRAAERKEDVKEVARDRSQQMRGY